MAYEWTDSQTVTDMATNMPTGVTNHRNVIFGTAKVPAAPLSATDYPNPPALWTGLDTACTAAAGCEVVTIPHNTDLSAGVSLVVWNPTPAGVAQQQKYQVSAEIYQHKAASECYYSPAEGYNDADCQFEDIRSAKTATNIGVAAELPFATGLYRHRAVGYAAQNTAQGNPLKLGIVGATDDHNGAPGNVDEARYVGHAGRGDDVPVKRLANSPENGSGALTGAWAEQNTRDRIFAAIKRRETFATSGPRIQVRFYQTSDATACADPSFPKKIVDAQTAVPMGGHGSARLAGAVEAPPSPSSPSGPTARWRRALGRRERRGPRSGGHRQGAGHQGPRAHERHAAGHRGGPALSGIGHCGDGRVRDVDRPVVRWHRVFRLLRPRHPGPHVALVPLVVRRRSRPRRAPDPAMAGTCRTDRLASTARAV